jgi:DNA recombination protein RmuC
VVVKLPGGRQIAVDAKVPLTAFLEASDSPDDARRKEALKQYASDVRGHVKRLSSREYQDKLGSSTDFVVMFLPGDSFLAAAFEQDREIFDSAIRNKVLIATPVTLVALLRTAALYWQQHALAENAERIGEEAKELYSRIANFAEPLQAIGKELDGAVKAYNRAVGSFEGRLLPHVRKMDELGGGDPSRKPLADLTQIETSPRALKAGE